MFNTAVAGSFFTLLLHKSHFSLLVRPAQPWTDSCHASQTLYLAQNETKQTFKAYRIKQCRLRAHLTMLSNAADGEKLATSTRKLHCLPARSLNICTDAHE